MREGNFWGLLVKTLREERDISQRRLAAITGVNRSTLRKLENGETRGGIDLIEVLLDYLGYELDALEKDSKAQAHPQYKGIAPQSRRSKLAATRILRMSFIAGLR
jgi:transcriptional regulator with XRE-family HTH domain